RPERVEKEPDYPERLGARSETEVMGQQFFTTHPNQHHITVDHFWHHEIAAPEGHNSRKLVTGVVVQSHHEFNVRNRTATLEKGALISPKRCGGRSLEAAGNL